MADAFTPAAVAGTAFPTFTQAGVGRRRGWGFTLLVAALLSAGASVPIAGEPARTIRVTMDNNYPPFVFQSSEGKLQGILIDQWQAWERQTGIKVEIHALDWGDALGRMRAGEFDVIDTIFETPERRSSFDFTPAYASVDVPIFFRHDLAGITDLKSLQGFPVAAKVGDNAADLLRKNGVTTVVLFPNYEAIVEAAKQNRINVFVADAPPARYFLNKLGIADEFRQSAPVYVGAFHRAVRKGDAALQRTITEGFAAIGPGELRQIAEKWFGRRLDGGRYLTYAGYGAVVGFVLLAGLFGWNRGLKKIIARRTATLRESEQQFRQLAENIHEVFWLIDVAKRKVLYVSPAYEEVWGRTCASLYASANPWPDHVHPDDLERVRQMLITSKTSGRYDEEFRLLRPDGSIRWIRERAFPVKDAAGVVYRIAGVAKDITEQMRAEVTSHRLAAMVEFSQDAIIGKDLNCLVTSWNKGAEKIFGYTASEMAGTSIRRLNRDDRPDEHHHIVERIKRGENVEHFETEQKTKDGRVIQVSITASPIKDAMDVVIGVSIVARDITIRRRAESALQTSEARYRTMLQSMEAGVIVHGADLCITAFNAKAAELLGVTPAQMTDRFPGDTPWNRVRADGSPFPDAELPYRRAQASRQPVRDVILGVNRPGLGNLVWLLVNANPVLTAQGEIAEVIVTFVDITARIEAEREVRFNATFTEDVLNSLVAHVVVLDEHGIIIAVNDAWRRFAQENGPGPVDFVGDNYLTVCRESVLRDNAPGAAAAAAGIQAVLEGGLPSFTLEYPCHSPAEERWFRLRVSPLSGGRKGVVVSHHDISESKRAEQTVQRSKKRLRDLIDGVGPSMLVGLLTPEGIVIEANVPALAAAGLKASDVLGRPFVDSYWFAHSADVQQRLREAIARAVRGEASRYDMQIRGTGGRLIDIDFSLNPVRDETGQVVFLVPSGNVITERKQSTEALRVSEKRFKALFEQAAVGVALSDAATGRFMQVNQRFAEIVGYTREELEQLTFASITHPRDVDRDRESRRQLNAGTLREFTVEKRYRRKDDSEVWVNLTVSPMWAAGEAPGLCIAIVQDITERKRLDEHMQQAQKMEALGQFSGGVAHDFNNILASISGYTELSRMTLRENPEVRGYLGAVLQASGRAADLVNQILTFSRQQPQERQTIQLQPVVEESLKLMRATIPSTIAFDTSIAADAPTVLANANQIHQVLMNLGVNAWHAMGDDPGRLQVRLERWVVDEAQAAAQPRLRPGPYARVSVSDTGCGMDAATVRRIFEPFFTTKPPGKGTGLGLSVVHGIMDGHDGAVTVYSQPSEGTVFHLYFPAHAGEAAQSAIDAGPVPRGKGESVLVVDDEELIASMVQEALIRLNYTAEFATDPTVALALVHADPQHFQLVLSDQTMPGMTGLALATKLREIRPDLPVILMTGFSASLTAERLEMAGVRQVLFKPLTVHLLGSAVHTALLTRRPN